MSFHILFLLLVLRVDGAVKEINLLSLDEMSTNWEHSD